MKLSSFLAFSLVFLLSACGAKKTSRVELELTGSLMFGGATLAPFSTGGLMIWGKSQSGESFGKVLRNSETFNLDLPNSNWTFYAMAWQSSSATVLEADVALRCAMSAVNLSGGESRVTLNLAPETCNLQSAFRGSLSDLKMMEFALHTCENINALTATTNRCRNQRDGAGYVSDKAPILSALVTLEAYADGISLPAEEGLSRCLTFPATDEGYLITAPSNLVFPQGSSAAANSHPFKVSVKYDVATTNCSSVNTLMLVTNLAQSVAQEPAANIKFLTNANQLHMAEAITDQRICQGKQQLSPFAGGLGTINQPYLICSERQLYSIYDDLSYLESSYRLGRSLNLLPYLKGVSATPQGYTPYNYSSWELGQTWEPLGDDTTGFKGNFDGNNHSITGVLQRAESSQNLGFIGVWQPTLNGQYIRDLKLNRVELSGDSYIGALIGKKSNGTQTIVENIDVTDSILEARNQDTSMTGGVIGQASGIALSNVRVRKTKVMYEGSHVGGVFGHLMNTTVVKELSSQAHILPRYRSPSTMPINIGGVGGYLDSTMLLTGEFTQLAFEGVLETIGFYAGGIFGQVGNTNTALTHFYVNAAIFGATLSSHQMGGIIGRINNSMIINTGYFAGSMIDKCPTGCARGLVYGSKDGPAIITANDIFVYTEDQATLAGGGDTGISTNNAPNRNGTGSLYDPSFAPSLSAPFVRINNSLPRFAFEQHPCLNPAGTQPLLNQLSSGLGTNANPLQICMKEQLEQLSILSPGIHAQVVAAVNIAGTFTPPSIPSGVHLLGKGGLLYGYTRTGNASGTMDIFSPINQNSGVIRHLSFANIQSTVISAAGGSENSGVVKINNGMMDDVHLLNGTVSNSVGTGAVKTAGFVSRNLNLGVIKNSSTRAFMSGQNELSGMVSHNSGLITESNIAPSITAELSGQNIIGITKVNDGQIIKNRLGGTFESNFNHSNVHLLAHNNNGLISDIDISSELRWHLPLNSPYSIGVFQNFGTMRRIVMKGTLYDTQNNIDSTTAANGKASNLGGGVIEGYFTVSPSGRRIFESSYPGEHNCSGNILRLNSPYYSAPIPFELGGTYFSSGLESTKKVWLVVENNGRRNAALLTNTITNTGAFADFGLASACDDLGFNEPNARFAIIQDHDSNPTIVLGNYFIPPFNGVITTNELGFIALSNPIWSNQFINPESSTDDLELMIDYFIREITGQPPIFIPPWELEEGQNLELFNLR